MREIKFRAWDGQKMLEPQDLSQSGVYWTWLGKQDVVLMQFTGLHDKNGKEIFFGDILATHNDGRDGADKWATEDFGLTVCREREGRLGVSFSDWHPTHSEDSVYNLDKYVEVIGNIYQNPELLKKV